MRVPLIIHERIGTWASQIRPRVATWPVRVQETRSLSDLKAAIAGWPSPILVMSLPEDLRRMVDHLEQARSHAPETLIMVLDVPPWPGLDSLLRETGATHVLARPVVPPVLLSWLQRWRDLACDRTLSAGWFEALGMTQDHGDRPLLQGLDFVATMSPPVT